MTTGYSADTTRSTRRKTSGGSASFCAGARAPAGPMGCVGGMLIGFDLLSIILFSGIIFGWAPLNSMLIAEGFYSERCPTPGVLCDAQKAALNQAFTYAASAVSFAALPAGWLLDACGPLVGSSLAGLLCVIGLAGIAVSVQVAAAAAVTEAILVAALVSVAVGGYLAMCSGFSLPFLFPQHVTLLMTLTNCLFDGSCIIFSGAQLLYAHAGVSFFALFTAYSVVAAVVFTLLVVAWALNRDKLNAARSPQPLDEPSEAADSQSAPLDLSSDPAFRLIGLPLLTQLRSPEFVAIFLYSALQVARCMLYLGTVDLVDREIGHTGSLMPKQVTTIVGLIIPWGCLAVPAINSSFRRLGLIGTLHVSTLVGVVHNVIQLVPNLEAQIGAACAFAAFRAFMYSAITAFVGATFGVTSMGRVLGVCFIAAAGTNMLQGPLVHMTFEHLGGNFRPLLIGSLVLNVPLPLLWIAVSLWRRRISHATVQLESGTRPLNEAAESSSAVN